LATSYNNVGGVYHQMGEYSKALVHYEKALDINQKNLPHIAISYNNIAIVHSKLGNYTKAVSFFERAHEILQCSSTSTHSLLQTVLKSLETFKKQL
jgi:tetratricopeptide (TPR) repeat protein